MNIKSASKLTFCFTICVLSAGYFVVGGQHGLDSSIYVSFGDVVLDWVLRDVFIGLPMREHVLVPHYIFPGFLIGICYEYFGAYGHQTFIALNILLFSFIAVLLIQTWQVLGYSTAYQIFPSFMLAIFLTFGLIDVPLWVYYDLTDIIFLFYFALFLFCMIKGIREQNYILIIASLILALFSYFVRPTAMLLPVIWVLFMSLLINKLRFEWVGYLMIAVISITTVLIIFGFPAFISLLTENQSLIKDWPSFLSKAVIQSRTFYEFGWVVADRPETYVLNSSGYADYLEITLKRLFYFYTPFRIDYSLKHTLTNALYLLITLPLTGYGIFAAWQNSDKDKRLVVVLITTSLLFGIMHAITLNSYDWRYQLPAMFPLWILSGIGGMKLLSNFSSRNNRYNDNT